MKKSINFENVFEFEYDNDVHVLTGVNVPIAITDLLEDNIDKSLMMISSLYSEYGAIMVDYQTLEKEYIRGFGEPLKCCCYEEV